VIYLTESVDEYVMQHLDNFQDIQFQNAVKEKLTLGGKDDKEKKKEKALRVTHGPPSRPQTLSLRCEFHEKVNESVIAELQESKFLSAPSPLSPPPSLKLVTLGATAQNPVWVKPLLTHRRNNSPFKKGSKMMR
jgi:hypothetical protein